MYIQPYEKPLFLSLSLYLYKFNIFISINGKEPDTQT